MSYDIKTFVAQCQKCALAKPAPAVKRDFIKFPFSDKLRTVHIDIVGPMLMSSRGNSYMITMMDRFCKWIEAVPVRSISAETCARVLVEHWISRYGAPEIIISDQGAQFVYTYGH